MARLNSGTREVQLNGIAEPSANTDAATKGYVDGEFARSTGQTAIADADLITFLDSSASNALSRITYTNFRNELEADLSFQDEIPTPYAPNVNVSTGDWVNSANANASTISRTAASTGTLSTLTDNQWGRLRTIGGTLSAYSLSINPVRWDRLVVDNNTRLVWDFGSTTDNSDTVTAMNDDSDNNRYMLAWADVNNWCVWRFTGTTDFFTTELSNGYVATHTDRDLAVYIVASAGEAQNSMAWSLYHTNDLAHNSWTGRPADEGDRLLLAVGDGDHVFWKKHFLDIDLQLADSLTTLADGDLFAVVDSSASGDPTVKITAENVRNYLLNHFQENLSEPYAPNYTTDWPSAHSDHENTGARTAAQTGSSSLSDNIPLATNNRWCYFTTANASPFATSQATISGTLSWHGVALDEDSRIGIDFGGTDAQATATRDAMNDSTDSYRFLACYVDANNWAVWHFTGTDEYFQATGGAIGTPRTIAWDDFLLAHAGPGLTSTTNASWAVFHSGTSALSTGTPLRAVTESDRMILDPRPGNQNEWMQYRVGAADINSTDTPSNAQVLTWNTGGTLTWEDQTGGTTVTANPTGATTDTLNSITIDSTNYNILTVNQTATQVRLDGSQSTPETGYQIDTFNATRAGVVGAASGIRPNWLTMQLASTVKSEVLAYQGVGAINNRGRRYQRYAGTNASPGVLSLVSTAPTSWEDFRGPTYSTTWDDTIRVDDEGGTYNSTVLANMRADTTDQTIVLVSDQNNWCILTMNAGTGGCYFNTAGDDPVLSVQSDRTSTGLVRPVIVAEQGSPQSTVQFFFPWSATTNAAITNLTQNVSEDDLLSVDGTFRTHHSHQLTNPAQLFNLFDMSYPTNIDRDSSGNVIRLRKYIFYGDYGAQYTATFDRNASGQVTQINLYHGDFDATETPGTVHRLARKVITRNVANTQVISVPILEGNT